MKELKGTILLKGKLVYVYMENNFNPVIENKRMLERNECIVQRINSWVILCIMTGSFKLIFRMD